MAPLEGGVWGLDLILKVLKKKMFQLAHYLSGRSRDVGQGENGRPKKRRWRFLTTSVAFTRSTHPSSGPMDAGKYSKTTPPDAGSWKKKNVSFAAHFFDKIQEQPLTHAHTHNKWTFCGDRRGRCAPHCHRLRAGRLDIFFIFFKIKFLNLTNLSP